jgi:hypothetical protein
MDELGTEELGIEEDDDGAEDEEVSTQQHRIICGNGPAIIWKPNVKSITLMGIYFIPTHPSQEIQYILLVEEEEELVLLPLRDIHILVAVQASDSFRCSIRHG